MKFFSNFPFLVRNLVRIMAGLSAICHAVLAIFMKTFDLKIAAWSTQQQKNDDEAILALIIASEVSRNVRQDCF